MSLISRIDELVKQGSQFIIATHSPILMAYPNSVIYQIKEDIQRVKYEDSENYNITREFLNNYKNIIFTQKEGEICQKIKIMFNFSVR